MTHDSQSAVDEAALLVEIARQADIEANASKNINPADLRVHRVAALEVLIRNPQQPEGRAVGFLRSFICDAQP